MHFAGGRDLDQGLQQGNGFHQATWVSGLVPGHHLIGAKVLYQIFMQLRHLYKTPWFTMGLAKCLAPPLDILCYLLPRAHKEVTTSLSWKGQCMSMHKHGFMFTCQKKAGGQRGKKRTKKTSNINRKINRKINMKINMKINKGPKKNQHKIENKKILIFKIIKGHIENINAKINIQ